MGYVAVKAAEHLIGVTEAELVGTIEALDCFHLPGVMVRNGVFEDPNLPDSYLYASRLAGAPRDLLVFLGEGQPIPGRELRLGEMVLDKAQEMGIAGVITFAALPTAMSHYDEPRVLISANQEEILASLDHLSIDRFEEGHITGMNGLLPALAAKRGLPGYCILGEIPSYTLHLENPRSSAELIKALGRLIRVEIDTTDLLDLAQFLDMEIDSYLESLKERDEADELDIELPPRNRGGGSVH
jgi:predicted ATP-grasp superfamily ATP-dependent carboligase